MTLVVELMRDSIASKGFGMNQSALKIEKA